MLWEQLTEQFLEFHGVGRVCLLQGRLDGFTEVPLDIQAQLQCTRTHRIRVLHEPLKRRGDKGRVIVKHRVPILVEPLDPLLVMEEFLDALVRNLDAFLTASLTGLFAAPGKDRVTWATVGLSTRIATTMMALALASAPRTAPERPPVSQLSIATLLSIKHAPFHQGYSPEQNSVAVERHCVSSFAVFPFLSQRGQDLVQ